MNQIEKSKFPLVIAVLALLAFAGCPQLFPPGTVTVTGVSLTPTSKSIVVGSTYQLTATITPADATNQSVIWASDTPPAATVSTSGLVTAVAAGTATVTVTTVDGGKTASCIVTVTAAPVAVTSVSLDPTSKTIPEAGSFQLNATVSPADATNQDVSWSSDTPTVATVSTSGLVTAVAVGTATVTVTTADGGKTAGCIVTVVVPVTGVNLDMTSKTIPALGSFQLTAAVAPIDAGIKTVSWASDTPSVATVSASGLVTGVIGGTATITVTTDDGGMTASCVVTVTPIARWANSIGNGSGDSRFFAVAADSSGNVYAAGYMGSGTNDFGNSVTAAGPNALKNMVLVKYNAAGVAQWARTPITGSSTQLSAVTVDSSGNVYVVGYLTQASGLVYDFGNSVTITSGPSSGWHNVILVKYDALGTPLWAQSVTPDSINNNSEFTSVAVDTSGNVFASGYIQGQVGTYKFSPSVTVTPGTNAGAGLLVKYDSSGAPQWAKTEASGNAAGIYSIALDSVGNVYAAGVIWGQTDFGNSVTPSGSNPGGYNVVLVKYDTSGVAQWAQTTTAGSAESDFLGVAVDSLNNIYAVGYVTKTGQYGFGNSVTAAGSYVNGNFGSNVLLVKYSSSGTAQWAKSVISGANNSSFSSVTVDSTGNLFVVGSLQGNGQFGFGNSISAAGSYPPSTGGNALLITYDPSGNAQWASTAPTSPSDSAFHSVAVGPSGEILAAGVMNTSGQFNFGNFVTATGSFSTGLNIVLVKYR